MIRVYSKKKLNKIIEIKDDKFHKIRDVLRMRAGEKIQVFDGKGSSQIMEIINISSDRIELKLLKNKIKKEKNSPEIILGLSLIKPARFEIAIEKTTELGVDKIYPLITQNTNDIFSKRYNEKRMDRMKNISISAAEQCGNDFIPTIEAPINLEDVIQSFNDKETGILFFYEKFDNIHNSKIELHKFKRLFILIGPEGGFSESEVKKINKQSIALSLGENILRTETAAICAVHEIKSKLMTIQ